MVSNIRAYKGARRVPPPSLPHTVAIDGQFDGWVSVKPEYRDDAGDTRPRDHKGFAAAGPYINRSGRNDIVRCLVARDDEAVYFYAETAEPLSSPTNSTWMNLLVHIPNHATPGWNGYHIRVSEYDPAAGTATIHIFRDGAWRPDGVIPMAHDTHRVELAIPRARWGKQPRVQLEFKWIDNMPEPLDILNFMDQGDAAPNNRFRYVYDSEPAAASP
jgi:hypothetical protein